jgi:hypothetical protein
MRYWKAEVVARHRTGLQFTDFFAAEGIPAAGLFLSAIQENSQQRISPKKRPQRKIPPGAFFTSQKENPNSP